MADVEEGLVAPTRSTYARRRQQLGPHSDDDASPPPPGLFDSSPTDHSHEGKGVDEGDAVHTSTVTSDEEPPARNKSRATNSYNRVQAAERAETDLSQDEEGDLSDDPVARVRASMLQGDSKMQPRSSQFSASNGSSSLSSAPPLSRASQSQPRTSDDVSSGSEADAEEPSIFGARRGALAGRMKKRGDKAPRNIPAREHQRIRDPVSSSSPSPSPSQSPPSSNSTMEAARRDRAAQADRRSKLAAMAAAKKKTIEQTSLEDEFFGQVNHAGPDSQLESNSQGEDPIHSGSSEEDDDVLQSVDRLGKDIRGLKKKKQRSQPRPSRPKGPKPLSKKELEEMHKTSARISRGRNVATLDTESHPVSRLQYDIGTLAAKFALSSQKPADPSDNATDDTVPAASSDPIEAETPRVTATDKRKEQSHAAAAASPIMLKSRKALTSAQSSDEDDDNFRSVGDFMAAQEAKKRQEALRLKKEKYLLSMQSEAQRSGISAGSSQADLGDDVEVISPNVLLSHAALRKQPLASSKVPAVSNGRAKKDSAATRLFQADLARHNEQPQSRPAQDKQGRSKRSGPPSRQLDLKSDLLQKIKMQNIRARASRDQGGSSNPRPKATPQAAGTEQAPDDSIDALKMIQQRARGQHAGSGSDEGGGSDGSDLDFVPEDNAADEQGSGSELEIPQSQQSLVHGSDEDEEDDEFGLGQAPPSSQNTHRSSGSVARAPSDEEEEEEDHAIRAPRKSRIRAALSDEEDMDVSADLPADEPGNAKAAHSMTLAGSFAAANPSGTPVGLTQFFADTQVDGDEPVIPESQQGRVDQHPAPPTAPAPSDDSVLGQFFADTQVSAPARGESLDVIGATGRARNAEIAPFITESASLSQFFEEGTLDSNAAASATRKPSQLMGPPATIPQDGFAALRRAAQAPENLLNSPDSLPSIDEFGEDGEDDLRSQLPPPALSHGSAHRTPKQYLNREGFFTQTRPLLGSSQWNASQSQSQDALDHRRGSHASRAESLAHESEEAGSSDEKKSPLHGRKRFRRALNPENDDGEDSDAQERTRDQTSVHGDDDGDVSTGEEGDVADARGSGSEDDDSVASPVLNAWNVLRKGASSAKRQQEQKSKKRQRDFQFVEGEAVESDEEMGDRSARKGAGVFDGVWDKSGSEDEDDEDDEDEDGADLENLVDNEKDQDEEEKDVLARNRYQQDLDEDDAARLALAQKAAQGKLRNRRRGKGDGDLMDVLDDDFDEERMMRAMNPRAHTAKRRKVEGDEMESLAAKAETKAFADHYNATHQADGGERYSFLENNDDSDQESHQQGESSEDESEGSQAGDFEDEEVPKQQRITRNQLAKELREKRMRRKQGIFSDNDDEDGDGDSRMLNTKAPRPARDPFASDGSEDEGDGGLPSFLREHAAAAASSKGGSAAGTTGNDGDGEDDDESTTLINVLSRQKRSMSPRSAKRLAQLADEFKSEPDFQAGRSLTYASKGGMGGSSITSFGAKIRNQDRQKAGAGAFERDSKQRKAAEKGKGPAAGGAAFSGGSLLAARRVEESQ